MPRRKRTRPGCTAELLRATRRHLRDVPEDTAGGFTQSLPLDMPLRDVRPSFPAPRPAETSRHPRTASWIACILPGRSMTRPVCLPYGSGLEGGPGGQGVTRSMPPRTRQGSHDSSAVAVCSHSTQDSHGTMRPIRAHSSPAALGQQCRRPGGVVSECKRGLVATRVPSGSTANGGIHPVAAGRTGRRRVDQYTVGIRTGMRRISRLSLVMPKRPLSHFYKAEIVSKVM